MDGIQLQPSQWLIMPSKIYKPKMHKVINKQNKYPFWRLVCCENDNGKPNFYAKLDLLHPPSLRIFERLLDRFVKSDRPETLRISSTNSAILPSRKFQKIVGDKDSNRCNLPEKWIHVTINSASSLTGDLDWNNEPAVHIFNKAMESLLNGHQEFFITMRK